MRINSAVTLVGVDASIATVVPLLVKRWQDLAFDDDGVVIVAGKRREGLALVAGEHPRTGARYEIVTAGEHPGHYTAETVADTPTELRLRIEQPDDVPIDLTVAGSKVTAAFGGTVDRGGSVEGSATLDLDRLPGDEPQLVVAVKHDRAVGDVKAWVRPTEGTWRLHAKADVRGRGLLRPLIAPLLWIRGRRALTQALERVASEVTALSERCGNPLDPKKVADKIADDFLASVVPYKLRT